MVMLCASVDMPGRPCTMFGEHLDGCDWAPLEGEAARRGVEVSLVLSERYAAGLPSVRPCKGCLPYKAEVGMLCRLCDERWKAALSTATRLVSFLLSGGSPPADVNKARGKPGPRLPIKEATIAADELWMELAGVAIVHASEARMSEPWWPAGTSVRDGFMPSLPLSDAVDAMRDLVTWVEADSTVTARQGGAEAAIGFYREVQRQLARFPLEEKPRRVPYLRCRECRQFAVIDHPPLHFMDVRVHQCGVCGAMYDPMAKEFDLAVYRQEIEAAIAERRGVA